MTRFVKIEFTDGTCEYVRTKHCSWVTDAILQCHISDDFNYKIPAHRIKAIYDMKDDADVNDKIGAIDDMIARCIDEKVILYNKKCEKC